MFGMTLLNRSPYDKEFGAIYDVVGYIMSTAFSGFLTAPHVSYSVGTAAVEYHSLYTASSV